MLWDVRFVRSRTKKPEPSNGLEWWRREVLPRLRSGLWYMETSASNPVTSRCVRRSNSTSQQLLGKDDRLTIILDGFRFSVKNPMVTANGKFSGNEQLYKLQITSHLIETACPMNFMCSCQVPLVTSWLTSVVYWQRIGRIPSVFSRCVITLLGKDTNNRNA